MNDKEFLQNLFAALVRANLLENVNKIRFQEIIKSIPPDAYHSSTFLQDRENNSWGRLSDSELEICRGLAAWKTPREIAETQPVRSLKTVETHIEHCRQKLNIPSTLMLRKACVDAFLPC